MTLNVNDLVYEDITEALNKLDESNSASEIRIRKKITNEGKEEVTLVFSFSDSNQIVDDAARERAKEFGVFYSPYSFQVDEISDYVNKLEEEIKK